MVTDRSCHLGYRAGAHVQRITSPPDLGQQISTSYSGQAVRAPVLPTPREFMGYRRADGQVGIRNEVWILCTVGCVAQTVHRIAELRRREFAGRTDGIFAFGHPFGCSQLGDDLSGTRQLLAALAQHPNAGAVLIVGLGLENNQLTALIAELGPRAADRLAYFNAQAVSR